MYRTHESKAFFWGARLGPCHGTARLAPRAGLRCFLIVLASWLCHLSFRKTSKVILSYFLILFGLTTRTTKEACLEVKLLQNCLIKLHLTAPLHLTSHPSHPVSPGPHSCSFLQSSYPHVRHLRLCLRISLSHGFTSQTQLSEAGDLCLLCLPCVHMAGAPQALVEGINKY